MCGISALYRYSQITDEDLSKLRKMNEEMHYRGPDDNGTWHDNTCALAQTRLSIIGLEKGKQPIFNEDGSLVLICNGEIYNYIELKEMLTKKGHRFSTTSDSEMIVHLYEEYGDQCVDHLRGQFAFCLWDSKNERLFTARDRIGEKTLYYAQVPGGVIFSSELKVILKHFIPKPQLNLEQLAAPIRYTSPTNLQDTWIDQIKRVEPGQYMITDKHGLRKYMYWKRDFRTHFTGSVEEAKKETLRLMRESVDIHLRSDVPVAVMLSGGIDSSAIAALAKETGREVHTITAGYKGQHDVDERDIARRFAKERGFIYHEIELDEDDFKNCFAELTEHTDEPVSDAGSLAQWALYKKVKSLGFKVLLGGMGGDELFYGYPYWNQLGESLKLYREHQQLFPWETTAKKKQALTYFLKNWKYLLKGAYPKRVTDRGIGIWHYDRYKTFTDTAKIEWDGREVLFKDIDVSYAYPNGTEADELDTVYDFQFRNIMTMVYLYLSDRLGMGNSIEIRSPLVDYKLVEFVSSLPTNMKYRKGQPKYFLKEVLKETLPDYILYGKKRGFTPPWDFIEEVIEQYRYQMIRADYKFYNSIAADRIVSLNLNKNHV